MSQPIKSNQCKTEKKKRPAKRKIKTALDWKIQNANKKKRTHPKYGTSKLEDRFAKEFLDRLGVKYVRQFEAKEISRFYDFYLPEENICIEVDGDFYHSYGLKHEEKNPMQKKNEWVDKVKDEWCYIHGIPIIRIWEHDINNNPDKVMKLLKEKLHSSKLLMEKKAEKNRRH